MGTGGGEGEAIQQGKPQSDHRFPASPIEPRSGQASASCGRVDPVFRTERCSRCRCYGGCPSGSGAERLWLPDTQPRTRSLGDMHQNARTTRHSRMLMIERLQSGWPVAAVAAAWGRSQDGAQVARPPRRRGRGWPARPLLEAASPARPGSRPGWWRRSAAAAPAADRAGHHPQAGAGLDRRRGPAPARLGRLAALEPKPQ